MRAFIHAPYLVNLGSPTPRRTRSPSPRSPTTCAGPPRSAPRASSCTPARSSTRRRDAAESERGTPRRCARSARACCRCSDAVADDDAPWLLLEPTAGQGRSLCAGVEDLEPYLAALDFHPKAGICLDTCHVFAAGAPLDEPGGATATVDRIVEIGGPGRLRLVHANDSMDVRGAFKDRHQRIGEGHIGADAFVELFAHPATAGVPFVLETPGLARARQRRHPAAQAAAREAGRRRTTPRLSPAVRRCSRPRPCSAMTACWGIDVLPDPRPARPGARPSTSWRSGSRSPASLLLVVAPRAVGRLSPETRRAGGRARRCSTASPRSCRPPAWRTPPASVSGFITGMYVVAHAAASPPLLLRTRITAHDLGRRRARHRRARRC